MMNMKQKSATLGKWKKHLWIKTYNQY